MSETIEAPEKVNDDLFAEEPEPTEPTDHAEAEATKPEPQAEEKPPKQPTRYVVLVAEDDETDEFPTKVYEPLKDKDGEVVIWQGFRREEVLQEVVDARLIAVLEDGFTAEVAIIPVRSFVTMRGKVETRRRVVKA